MLVIVSTSVLFGQIHHPIEAFTIVGEGHLPEDDEFFRGEYDELHVGQSFDDVTLLELIVMRLNCPIVMENTVISYIFTMSHVTMCPAVVMKTKYLAAAFLVISQSTVQVLITSMIYLLY